MSRSLLPVVAHCDVVHAFGWWREEVNIGIPCSESALLFAAAVFAKRQAGVGDFLILLSQERMPCMTIRSSLQLLG